MTGALWGGGALVAIIAGSVAIAFERERVARGNYFGARKVVKIARRTWFAALRVATTAVLVVGLLLALAYLIAKGPQR